MRNLLVFFSKYNAFFLFLLFEILSLVIYINYNSFQKASFINSSNEITGNIYTRINEFYSYLDCIDIEIEIVHGLAVIVGGFLGTHNGCSSYTHI